MHLQKFKSLAMFFSFTSVRGVAILGMFTTIITYEINVRLDTWDDISFREKQALYTRVPF